MWGKGETGLSFKSPEGSLRLENSKGGFFTHALWEQPVVEGGVDGNREGRNASRGSQKSVVSKLRAQGHMSSTEFSART